MGNVKITTSDFEDLMETVARGWNEGNARKAADYFSRDAVDLEPLDEEGVAPSGFQQAGTGWLWRINISAAWTISRHRDCENRIGVDQRLARVSISDQVGSG